MSDSQNVEIIQKRDDNILVRIQIQDKETWNKEYSQETLLNVILEEYASATGNEFPSQILEYWQNQKRDEDIKQQELRNFINKYEEGDFILGSNNLKIPEIIGKPFNDPFCIFAFEKRNKILKVLNLSGRDLNGLENYGPYSAYCNGCIGDNNKLFISGGESNDKKCVDKFWQIDLNSLDIECINMVPKKSHSMILVPGNFIFIVGGKDKETFYFDYESTSFYGWKPLNEIRIEPALILINDYLYCFDNINSNKFTNDLTFEKTNLNSNEHQWELMHVVMPSIKFDQKFFGVVQKDDDIIFVGGNIDIDEENRNRAEERKNFKYNINSNKLEVSEIPFIEFNLKEKTLLPYNDKVSYIFPDFNKHYPEIVFFQKNKNKIKLVKYEPISKLNDSPPPKINRNHKFDQPDPDNNNDNMNEVKINIINNLDKDIINKPELNVQKNDFNVEPINENILKSDIIINPKEEKEIVMPNMKENNDINLIDKDINNHQNDEFIGGNLNPEININENNIKKSFVNIETDGKENASEDAKTDQLKLLHDILNSSEQEIKISKQQGNGENDINIIFSEIKNNNDNNEQKENEKEQMNNNTEKPNEQVPEKEQTEEMPINSLANQEIKIEEEKKEEQPEENAQKLNNLNQIEPNKEKENQVYDFYISGTIEGTKKSKSKDSDKKIEGNVNIPSNINIKNSNEKKDDKKDKGFILTGVIVGTKETDLKILKYKDKKGNQDDNYAIRRAEINIDTNINEIKPDINIKEGSTKLKGPTISENEMKLKMKSSNVNIDNKVDINVDTNIQNVDLNKNQGGISVPIQNGEFPSGKVELKGNISENINEKGPEINAKFNSNIPELIGTETDAKRTNHKELQGSTIEQNVKPFDINNQNPNLNVKAEINNQDNNNNQSFKLSGIIYGTSDPKYNKNKNLPSENKSEMEKQKPKLDINGNIIGNDINVAKIEINNNNKEELNNNEGIKLGINFDIDQNPKESNINLEQNNEVKIESNLKISENGIKGNKITLPAVGIKNENFVASKVDEGGNLNEINFDIVNMKSSYAGINGQKNGERIENK